MKQLTFFKNNQRQRLGILVLMLCLLGPTTLDAQDTKKHTEPDGFVWYETFIDHGFEVKDANGYIIIPHTRGYNPLSYHHKYFRVGKTYKKIGLCDLSGNEIISPDRGYYDLMVYDEWIEVTKVDDNNKRIKGVCDLSGKEIISPDRGYDDVSMYGSEWFRVKRNGKMGACDLSGREFISPDKGYDLVTVFRGWVGVKKGGKNGVCDLSGKELLSPDRGYDDAIFWDDVILVNVNNKYGICDLSGNEVISPMYDVISKKDGALYYKDANGEWQPIPASSYTSPSYAAAFNKTSGTTANKDQVQRKKIVENDGYVWYNLFKGSYQGVEDANGNTLIPLSLGYTRVESTFRQGKRYFKGIKNNVMGCYDDRGTEMVSPDRGYNHVTVFSDHLTVTKNGKQGICDLSGYEIISPDRGYDDVTMLGDYIKVERNRKYGACDFAGNEVVAPIYNDMLLFSDGVFQYKDERGNYKPVPVTYSSSNDVAATSSSSGTNSYSNTPKRSVEYYQAQQRAIMEKYSRNSSKSRTTTTTPSNRTQSSSYNRSTTQRNTTTSSTSNSSTRNHSKKICTECKGAKKVTCHLCKGKGRDECYLCHGSGMRHVFGKPGVKKEKCYRCNGVGSTECKKCSGSGKIRCTRCGGSGYW